MNFMRVSIACKYWVAVAASPLAHDSAYASNNNSEWMGLLPHRGNIRSSPRRGIPTPWPRCSAR
jgi:hypothetical protein